MIVASSGWAVALVVALVTGRARAARAEAIARACHELRGPLTAARLGLELSGRRGELPLTRVRTIDLELRRAALALEDLAAAQTREPVPRYVEQVDVEELLEHSVEAWWPLAAQRDLPLTLEWIGPPARVDGDRLRLAQATGNLIANAIEHGGGSVVVRGRASRSSVRVEVIDRGRGLPAPVAELTRRPRGGRGRRGRGLAIASAVAVAHGGRLAAAPIDRGARIVLELPVSEHRPLSAPVAG